MALASIEDFIGYGPSEPRVVFLGTEESAGGSEPCANEATKLAHFEPIMDLAAAVAILARLPGFVDPFAQRGNGVEQWNRAAEIRLALAEHPWEHHREWSRYWRSFLGRSGADTLLMECFPMPRARMHVHIDGYDPYRSWPSRRDKLRAFTSKIRPEYVVAYGEPAGERVSQLFPIAASTFGGLTAEWHVLDRVGTIGRTDAGTTIARVGFFGGGFYRRANTSALAARLREHHGAACPLNHAWSPGAK